MLQQLCRYWFWAGINNHTSANITPLRLTNIISFLAFWVLVLQIPISLCFAPQNRPLSGLLLVVFHGLLMCLIPLINKHKLYFSARLSLVCFYSTYILGACYIWQDDLHIQDFFLLGLFVVAFIFYDYENRYWWFFSLLFVAGFVVIQSIFIFNPGPVLSQQVLQWTVSLSFALACWLCSYFIRKNLNCSLRKLTTEKNRSEQILLNILPPSIAQRLTHSNTLLADYFEQASVIFADIQGFTKVCRCHSPNQLVALLNEVFCSFDRLVNANQLEKIKTVGDSYMAAAGLPLANQTHALQCCEIALQMRDTFSRICRQHQLNTGLRIGISSGELIAGVIGQQKFCYDLWGDAVNLASRMESHGECHRIQVTHYTYELAKHKFQFEERGKIQVKGIGPLTTYWLTGKKHDVLTG